MSSEERAVPKTLARAEVTATACRLPSPSLNILGYHDIFCMTAIITGDALYYFSKRLIAKKVIL